MSISSVTAFRPLVQDPTDYKATLVQLMAWCHQAPNHWMNQCWQKSVKPYVVTRPQEVSASYFLIIVITNTPTETITASWYHSPTDLYLSMTSLNIDRSTVVHIHPWIQVYWTSHMPSDNKPHLNEYVVIVTILPTKYMKTHIFITHLQLSIPKIFTCSVSVAARKSGCLSSWLLHIIWSSALIHGCINRPQFS